MLKVMSVKAGVKRLDLNERDLLLHLSPEHQETPHAVVHMIMSAKDRFWLTPENVLKAKLAGTGLWGRLNQTKNILKEIAHRVNGSSPYHSDIPKNLDRFMRAAGKAK